MFTELLLCSKSLAELFLKVRYICLWLQRVLRFFVKNKSIFFIFLQVFALLLSVTQLIIWPWSPSKEHYEKQLALENVFGIKNVIDLSLNFPFSKFFILLFFHSTEAECILISVLLLYATLSASCQSFDTHRKKTESLCQEIIPFKKQTAVLSNPSLIYFGCLGSMWQQLISCYVWCTTY